MTKTGIVKKWDAAKGFGFIRSQAIPVDVFFHHKAFESTVGLFPHEGLAVRFEEINVGGKGPRATHVKPVVDRQTAHSPRARPGLDAIVAKAEAPHALTLIRPHRSSHPQANSVKKINPVRTGSAGRAAVTAAPPGLFAYFSLLMIWLDLLVAGLMMQRFSVWVLAALAKLNVITLFAYAFDKNAAERSGWRTQESTLHLFALAGGWPVAWMAQQILRHKTSKHSFQSTYWTTAALHCTGLAAWVFGLQQQLARHLT